MYGNTVCCLFLFKEYLSASLWPNSNLETKQFLRILTLYNTCLLLNLVS